MQTEWLTPTEVATRLKVKPGTIRMWARQRKLPFRRVGKAYRFDWAELLQHIDDGKLASVRKRVMGATDQPRK
jgi:excisionase family DNA binding protein